MNAEAHELVESRPPASGPRFAKRDPSVSGLRTVDGASVSGLPTVDGASVSGPRTVDGASGVSTSERRTAESAPPAPEAEPDPPAPEAEPDTLHPPEPTLRPLESPPSESTRRRMSTLLRSLAATWPGTRLTLGDLESALGDRSFGVLLLVFCIPALVPGVATVATVPLVLLGAQLALGHPTPWMPAFVRRRSMATTDFARIVRRVAPIVERVERLLRPRAAAATTLSGERLIGAMCAALALLLPVPLPFGNAIVVFPILVLALALIERDGRVALGGLLAGVACAAFFLALTWVTLRGSFQLATHYIGHHG